LNFIQPPSNELLQFLSGYFTWCCDLDLWPWSLITWVVNPCTEFELDTTYRYRVRSTTIFHWPQA